MLLQKITLTDFGIYGGRNEFELASRPDRPIILCGGRNGSGKTTLFESISLCLYGQNAIEPKMTQKQYRNKILKSFHRYGGTKMNAEEASITLEFHYAHEGKITPYKITRMWHNNRGKVEETLHVGKKSGTDKSYVDLDSVEQSQWQSFVDHILPKGITKLFFFDGEKIQSIAESGKEDLHIKSSFDSLLGLDLVHQLHDDIGLYMLRNSDGDTQKILDDIEQMTTQKQESESRIEDLQEKQIAKQAEINSIHTKLQGLEKKFMDLGGQYATRRQHLMASKDVTKLYLRKAEKRIRDLCNGILPFCLVPNQLTQIRNEIESDIQKAQDSFEKNILEKAFSDITKDLESSLGGYDEKTSKTILAQLAQIMEKKIGSISTNRHRATFNFSLEDMTAMQDLISNINQHGRNEIESLTNDYDKLLDSLNKTNAALDMAPQQDEIGPLFSEINRLNKEVGILEHELDGLKNLEAQEKSMIVMLNSKIRQNLAKRKLDKRRIAGLEMAPKVQEVLEEYARKLRLTKVSLLESNILDGMCRLFHKKDYVASISINPENFDIKLYKNNKDELTREMMSTGELQVYATAIVWGLAKTSGRPLPFIIDTPLARLDIEHRKNLVENFYPEASHQTIIFSTNSEIVEPYYEMLKPHISHSILIKYDPEKDRTVKQDGYFFDRRRGEGQEIEI